MQYLQQNAVELFFGLLSLIISGMYADVVRKLEVEHRKSNAVAEGVQSLLRENIVHNYNKYTEREYCPIYAKESIKRVYAAYHNLGGNDVATKLYEKILDMPEEPEKERN